MADDYQPLILSPTDSVFWRELYLESFIDISSEYYQRYIATPDLSSDGVHYEGYLWDCLRSWSRITTQRFRLEIILHSEVFVMADDHARNKIPGAELWPYPSYSVAVYEPQHLLENLESLPEDIYIFDSSVSWTLIQTHEHDARRQICCAVGI